MRLSSAGLWPPTPSRIEEATAMDLVLDPQEDEDQWVKFWKHLLGASS